MRLKGFGPDILHHVSQDSLVNLGITPGDAIRLQNNAPKWWNGSHAKRKRSGLKANQQKQLDTTPPNKRVRFEKHYYDGGKHVLWGSKLIEGDLHPNADFQWHYHSYEHDSVIPIPQGYVPLFEEEDY